MPSFSRSSRLLIVAIFWVLLQLMNSVGAQTRVGDQFCPAREIAANRPCKIVGRAAGRLATLRQQSFPRIRTAQGARDLIAKPDYNFVRHAFGRQYAEPGIDVVPRHGVAYRWDV